ncbi:MAG: hypothetical protein Q9M94_03055 [Candidatus Gracilibacteria bacterium]|nr:hypothetical protein [Candidatus Gracilibacteria bacterium]MDQ7022055.1 hypothetical protein [Candidatus Gracilibacteria bacterium]
MTNIKILVSIITLFFLISSIGNSVYSAEEGITEEKKEFIVTKDMLKNWPYKHELTHTDIKILHKPAWMYMVDNKISCDQGAIYYILDEEGNKIKKNALNCKIAFEDDKKTEIVVDEIFEGIEAEGDESEDIDLTSASENPNNEINEDNNNISQEEIINENEEQVDDFIDDILGANSSNKLRTVKLSKEEFFLTGKQVHQSIKSFSINKNIILLDDTKIKGLKGEEYYNGSIATLFINFSEKVSINKYRNQFAKHLSDISYSLSSYHNEELDNQSREIFRKKLVNDMKKVQVGYIELQNKEEKLYKFFFNKG